MKIESEEVSVSGMPAVALIIGLVLSLVIFNSFFRVNPENDEALQSLLREDIKRYLVTSEVSAGIHQAEALLAKSPNKAQANMVRTRTKQLVEPTILKVDTERKKLNTFCGSDMQYHVRVRYRAQNEQSLQLRYCFNRHEKWRRSSTFHVK